jgi:hypothetical protein
MWAAEIGRIMVLSQSGQKSLPDHIPMEKSKAWWYIPVISEMSGSLKYED